MALHMKRLNIKQARRREALGRVGNKLDTSIMTSKHAAEYKEQLKRDNEESGHVEELNAHAFEDLTDFGVRIVGELDFVAMLTRYCINRMPTLYTASNMVSCGLWAVVFV